MSRKSYIPPRLRVVSFRVDRGFAPSSPSSFSLSPDGSEILLTADSPRGEQYDIFGSDGSNSWF